MAWNDEDKILIKACFLVEWIYLRRGYTSLENWMQWRIANVHFWFSVLYEICNLMKIFFIGVMWQQFHREKKKSHIFVIEVVSYTEMYDTNTGVPATNYR